MKRWILLVALVGVLGYGCGKVTDESVAPTPAPPEKPATGTPPRPALPQGTAPTKPALPPSTKVTRPVPTESLAALLQKYQSLAGQTDARSELIADLGAMSGQTAKPAEVADALAKLFTMESDTDLKREIVDELGALETPAALAPILAACGPGQPADVQETAADAADTLLTDLSFSDDPTVITHIAKALDPQYPSAVRQSAISALEDTDNKDAIPLLEKYRNDPDADVRAAAISAIDWLKE